jgi:hypothetical protein
MNAVIFERAALVVERDDVHVVVAGGVDRFVMEALVGEHELVTVEAVFVPVMHAPRFPAAVQVVEIGLVILIGNGQGRIFFKHMHVPVSLAVVLERCFGDLLHALAMERHVVLAQAREGKPGLEHHPVKGKAAIGTQERQLRDVPVEVTQRAVLAHQGNRDQPAHQHLERNARVVRQDVDLEPESARDLLARDQLVWQQNRGRAVLERKIQSHQPVVLRVAAKCR